VVILTPFHGALERSLQFIRRAMDGLIDGRCPVPDGNGLMALEPTFHHAPLVVQAPLVAALAADVDVHPCCTIAESVEDTLHQFSNVRDEPFGSFGVVVRLDLDLHRVP
jgi:hypothetical protein